MIKPKDSFDLIAAEYAKMVDTKALHLYYERPNLLALLPEKLKNLKILDLGCGTGWYAEHLLNRGGLVTAIDASPTMVDLTKERAPGCTVHLMDLEEPFDILEGQCFDIIIAPLVIHYVKDWQIFFKRLADQLKNQGIFVFSTHSPHTEFITFNLESYFEKTLITDYWDHVGEVKFYHHTLDELTESLFQAGFYLERLREPQPSFEMKHADEKMSQNLLAKPWFLFGKAIKKSG